MNRKKDISELEHRERVTIHRWVAYTGTGFWLFIAIALAENTGASFTSLNLAEKGDYLAGIFSPLALFWVILGYVQNSEELRINSLAQIEQAESLNERVKVAEKRFEKETKELKKRNRLVKLKSQPKFTILSQNTVSKNTSSEIVLLTLMNYGAECFDLVIIGEANDVFELKKREIPYLGKLDKIEELRIIVPTVALSSSHGFSIRYIDALEEPMKKRIEFHL